MRHITLVWRSLQDVDGDLRLRCKSWILDTAALALVAHTTSADSPQLRDATQGLLSALLRLPPAGSAQEDSSTGHVQADTVLLSVLDDLSLLQRCDLRQVWQTHQVRDMASAATVASVASVIYTRKNPTAMHAIF